MTSLSGVRDLGFSGDLDLERDFGIGEASDKSLSISTLGKTCKQFFNFKIFSNNYILIHANAFLDLRNFN